MADADRPQIYLITPPQIDLEVFPDQLSKVLDQVQVACLRLSPVSRDAALIGRMADAVRAVAHERDVAVVIDSHLHLVAPHGLDGVHLSDGAKSVRYARKELGADAVIGTFSGISRHDGMTAAEAGADYVAFGPVGASALGAGGTAPEDLFEWWSEIIAVPVVAEGALTEALIRSLAPITDFFGIGEEIWGGGDPAMALRTLAAAMG